MRERTGGGYGGEREIHRLLHDDREKAGIRENAVVLAKR